MAEIEDQVRLLADRRFARTAAVATEQIRPAAPSPPAGLIGADAATTNFNDEPPAEPANHTVDSEPDEGDLIMVDIQTQETGTNQTDEMNRRRWARWAIVAAAAVIIVIVAVALFDGTEESSQIEVVDQPADIDAPEPPEQVTPQGFTQEDVVGIWRAQQPGSFVEYRDDGTYSIALTVEGLEGAALDRGSFSVEGTEFIIVSDEHTFRCAPGDRGVHHLERTADGFRTVLVDDDCFVRAEVARVDHTPASP